MRTMIATLTLALAVAGGCTRVPPAAAPEPAPAPAFSGGIEVDAMLRYIHRLHAADAAELRAIGERLQPPVGATAIARRALWQATPGHAGHAPDRARVALASLLDDDSLDRGGRLLLELQLEHLRERERLQDARADLEQENRDLRRQIEELTALERRMGEEGDNGE